MISDDLNCIFVHNPKTGGTAIKNCLQRLGSFTKQDWHYDAEKLFGFADRDHTSYYKFGTCRNPFSRMVSAFVYNCRNCADRNNYHWKSYPDSYAILKKWISPNQGDLINNFRYFVNSEDFDKIFDRLWPVHFKPQHTFFTPHHVNCVVRYENLQEDFLHVLSELGDSTIKSLPVVNSSNHVDYKEFYDSDTLFRVVDKYRDDFTIFGYTPFSLG